MPIEYWDVLGGTTVTTVISGSSLSGLANNASVLSSNVNNLYSGGGIGGTVLARLTLSYQFATAPTANTGIAVWIIRNSDGTTGSAYEDGTSSVTPARAPDVIFGVGSSPDTNAHVQCKDVLLPAGLPKFLLLNQGTGQAFGTTTGNLGLTVTPITYQGQ